MDASDIRCKGHRKGLPHPGRRVAGVALVACLAAVLLSCGGRRSQVRYPLILIPGFASKGGDWSSKCGLVPYLERARLRFGGVLATGTGGSVSLESESDGYDLYGLTFSDPCGPVGEQAAELDRAIHLALERSRAEGVILVGYSMGGVVAREYLVTHPRGHGVKRLVTIGSPHLGTPLALSYDLRRWIEENERGPDPSFGGTVVKGELGAAKSALAALEASAGKILHRDSFSVLLPAVADLRPPRDSPYSTYAEGPLPGRTFLLDLNRKAHPLDVDYACVVGEFTLDTYLREFEAALQDPDNRRRAPVLLKNTLYLAGNFARQILTGEADGTPFGGGDGVIGTRSQDLREVEFFRAHRDKVQVESVPDVGHLEQCLRHDAVLKAIGPDNLARDGKD